MDELPSSMLTDPNVRVRMTHGWEHFTLTPVNSLNEKHRVELVKVDQDGLVWIRALDTQEILKAYPGEPFIGSYEDIGHGLNVRTFGEEGLMVEASDPDDQSAVLKRFFGIYEYKDGNQGQQEAGENASRPTP